MNNGGGKHSNLLSELHELSQAPPSDEQTRVQIAAALRKAAIAIETPLESVRRVAYSPLLLVVVKIATDIGVFQLLGLREHQRVISIDEFEKHTKVEPRVLVRVLRYLSTMDLVAQVNESAYAATKLTDAFTHPGFEAGIRHYMEVHFPIWAVLPEFLASSHYQFPKSGLSTAFQFAHSTPLHAFEFATTRTDLLLDFSAWMATQRHGEAMWQDVLDISELLGEEENDTNEDPSTPLFVDVGGGLGHQCRALRAKLPRELKRPIILQDMAAALAEAGHMEGVTTMAHDLWQDQPVKGASFYYLRNILHDYRDEDCLKILQNIKEAMSPESRILIDECILPTTVTEYSAGMAHQVSTDMILLASLAGGERTRADWEALFARAAMILIEVRQYTIHGDSVLIVRQCGGK